MENYWSTPPEVDCVQIRNYENIWSEHLHPTVNAELLYVLDGKFTLTFDNGLKFPAVVGDFLLLPAHVRHRDVFEPSRGLRILIVQFNWAGADGYFSVVNNRTLCGLDFATRAEAMRRIDFMYEQWDPDSAWSTKNISIQLYALLALFYESALNANERMKVSPVLKRARSDVLQQVKFFITQNYASPITLAQLARRFEVSPAYLSRLFRREFGVGFNRYLITLRLEAAVALLHNTSLQIAEVASRSGFSDSGYFIKTFRRHYGTTPRHYRGTGANK